MDGGGDGKNRRKETYFNPPWSQNVQTNICAKFLKSVGKCFPAGHPLHSILNRHTLKVTYRTNMARVISKHNRFVQRKLQPVSKAQGKICSGPKAVRDSSSCPLGGHCLAKNTIYQATVTEVDSGKVETIEPLFIYKADL